MEELEHQKCVAYRADAPRITEEEVAALLPQIPKWSIADWDGILCLERTYEFGDFVQALSFTNKVCELPEKDQLKSKYPSIMIGPRTCGKAEFGRISGTQICCGGCHVFSVQGSRELKTGGSGYIRSHILESEEHFSLAKSGGVPRFVQRISRATLTRKIQEGVVVHLLSGVPNSPAKGIRESLLRHP